MHFRTETDFYIFFFIFCLFKAEKKGCTATEYGLVFGVFELIVFLVSPLYGQYLNRLGPKGKLKIVIFVHFSTFPNYEKSNQTILSMFANSII